MRVYSTLHNYINGVDLSGTLYNY